MDSLTFLQGAVLSSFVEVAGPRFLRGGLCIMLKLRNASLALVTRLVPLPANRKARSWEERVGGACGRGPEAAVPVPCPSNSTKNLGVLGRREGV